MLFGSLAPGQESPFAGRTVTAPELGAGRSAERTGEISARIDPRPLRVDERLYEIRESAYTHACFPDASRVEIRL